MRSAVLVVALAALFAGCSAPGVSSDSVKGVGSNAATRARAPISLDIIAGTYIGHRADESPLPDSIRDLVGDATLELSADPQRFAMFHKGIGFTGYYTVESDRLVLNVELVEGMTRDQLAATDLAENKSAKREPSTPEMLELYYEILNATDWTFEATSDGFREIGTDGKPGTYEFKRKGLKR